MGHSCWCSWELSHLRIQCMWNTWEQRPQTGKENADCVSCGDLIFLTCWSVPLRHLRRKEDGLPYSSFPHLWLKSFQPKPVNILYPASIIAVRIMGPLSPDNSFYCINDPISLLVTSPPCPSFKPFCFDSLETKVYSSGFRGETCSCQENKVGNTWSDIDKMTINHKRKLKMYQKWKVLMTEVITF